MQRLQKTSQSAVGHARPQEHRASTHSASAHSGRELKGGGSGVEEEEEEGLPIEWLNPAFGSFDDFGQSMLILYACIVSPILR